MKLNLIIFFSIIVVNWIIKYLITMLLALLVIFLAIIFNVILNDLYECTINWYNIYIFLGDYKYFCFIKNEQKKRDDQAILDCPEDLNDKNSLDGSESSTDQEGLDDQNNLDNQAKLDWQKNIEEQERWLDWMQWKLQLELDRKERMEMEALIEHEMECERNYKEMNEKMIEENSKEFEKIMELEIKEQMEKLNEKRFD